MNNLKLLKAQADLSMTQVDPKLRIGIERYIERLEELLRASLDMAQKIYPGMSLNAKSDELITVNYVIDIKDFNEFIITIGTDV